MTAKNFAIIRLNLREPRRKIDLQKTASACLALTSGSARYSEVRLSLFSVHVGFSSFALFRIHAFCHGFASSSGHGFSAVAGKSQAGYAGRTAHHV